MKPSVIEIKPKAIITPGINPKSFIHFIGKWWCFLLLYSWVTACVSESDNEFDSPISSLDSTAHNESLKVDSVVYCTSELDLDGTLGTDQLF